MLQPLHLHALSRTAGHHTHTHTPAPPLLLLPPLQAITNATLPYVLELASAGAGALLSNAELLKGLNVTGGKCTYRCVARACM